MVKMMLFSRSVEVGMPNSVSGQAMLMPSAPPVRPRDFSVSW
ncbi:hypothetical protein CADE109221_09735 [Castellaniella denitrificans]